jgi:hypothetical protein
MNEQQVRECCYLGYTMTPRGRLDERCFTEWLHGVVILALFTCLVGIPVGILITWALS